MYRKFVTIAVAAFAVAAGLGIGFAAVQRFGNETVRVDRSPTETATFAGGCFWGLEAAFRQVNGVTDTVVGYTTTPLRKSATEVDGAPRVENLEACRVTFDPTRIPYEKLVRYFLQFHLPAALGGRDPYLGSPARLVIFFQNGEQEKVATAAKERWQQSDNSRRFPIVEVLPDVQFDRAAEDQQHYLEKHGLARCRVGS